jgi:hypothetical protein
MKAILKKIRINTSIVCFRSLFQTIQDLILFPSLYKSLEIVQYKSFPQVYHSKRQIPYPFDKYTNDFMQQEKLSYEQYQV